MGPGSLWLKIVQTSELTHEPGLWQDKVGQVILEQLCKTSSGTAGQKQTDHKHCSNKDRQLGGCGSDQILRGQLSFAEEIDICLLKVNKEGEGGEQTTCSTQILPAATWVKMQQQRKMEKYLD